MEFRKTLPNVHFLLLCNLLLDQQPARIEPATWELGSNQVFDMGFFWPIFLRPIWFDSFPIGLPDGPGYVVKVGNNSSQTHLFGGQTRRLKRHENY
jgi:hypothetical protein